MICQPARASVFGSSNFLTLVGMGSPLISSPPDCVVGLLTAMTVLLSSRAARRNLDADRWKPEACHADHLSDDAAADRENPRMGPAGGRRGPGDRGYRSRNDGRRRAG